MKKNLLSFLFLTIFGLSNLFSQTLFNQQDTIDLVMSAGKGMDANTSSLDPFTTYDWEEKVQAYSWTQGGQVNVTRAFLQFDMTSVSSNSNILKAYLILHDTPIMTHSGINDCFVKRITSPWLGTTINHYNQPMVTNVDLVYIPQTTSQTLFEIDVTNMTQYFIDNPTENYGYRISLVDENPYKRLCFSSSECSDPSKRPMLRIIYNLNISVNNIDHSNITISPNPVATQLKINGFNDGTPLSIQMFSMIGQLVYTDNQFDANQTLDVTAIENGFYILKITNNGETVSKKILIQK